MNPESFENKIQLIIVLLVAFCLIIPIFHGMIIGNFQLLDKLIEVIKVPLGVIIAYYFGMRYFHDKKTD